MESLITNYTIRTMTRQDLDFAVELAAKEGWNPGLHEADCFYQADQKGFLIGFLDERPIGCISAVSYSSTFGFIGLYIVAPEYRGKGYGIQLWNAAMQRLKGHNIGLDGNPAQQENYKKSGFKLAYRNIRYKGSGGLISPDDDFISLSRVTFEELQQYDRRVFPAPRKAFLEPWISMPESKASGYVLNGRLKGYGVIRKCRIGYKIGPLFADDSQIAERLYLHLASYAENQTPVFLDVPEVNIAAISLAEKYNLKMDSETARMYTQEPPTLSLKRIFGITSFELG